MTQSPSAGEGVSARPFGVLDDVGKTFPATGERRGQAWIGWAGLLGVAIVSVIGAEMAARRGGAGLGI